MEKLSESILNNLNESYDLGNVVYDAIDDLSRLKERHWEDKRCRKIIYKFRKEMINMIKTGITTDEKFREAVNANGANVKSSSVPKTLKDALNALRPAR